MMTWVVRWVGLACLGALACACTSVEPRTQVMLIVDADEGAKARVALLDVRIDGYAAGSTDPSADPAATSFGGTYRPQGIEGNGWPYRFALVPGPGKQGRLFKVEVRAEDNAGALLAVVRAESGFVAGKTLALRLRLDTACLDGASLRCSEDDTCVEGECVRAGINPGSLPELPKGDRDIDPIHVPTGTIDGGIIGTAGAGGDRSTAGSGGAAGGMAEAGRGGASGSTMIPLGDGNCGDGDLNNGEACDTAIATGQPGACPTVCTAAQSCETVSLEGSGCQARCVAASIATPQPDDRCCPVGADSNDDPDCDALCGNGVVEASETCDPIDSCPNAATCIAQDACLVAVISGAAESCNATCQMEPIVACNGGDGCCPAGCSSVSDSDCSASCGDGVVDPAAGETCEAGSTTQPCPTTCDDGLTCTKDLPVGSAENCNAKCQHVEISRPANGDTCCPEGANSNNDDDCTAACGNGVLERGELCDASCPTEETCNDGNDCTADLFSGRECSRVCARLPILLPRAGDRCCAPGANANSDSDCEAACGNGVVEPGEMCDGNCPTPASCNDNDACTSDTVMGSGCARQCSHAAVRANASTKDGCCPSGANAGSDADCTPAGPVCGNDVVETGEKCDGNCPTPASCDDGMVCTVDSVRGANCGRECEHTPARPHPTMMDGCCPSGLRSDRDADCEPPDPVCGNDMVESGERCDGNCPACTDSDNCTREDTGSDPCNPVCMHIEMPGCCTTGMNANEDPDCPARCGNGVMEPGEQCEGVRPTCVDCRIVEPPDPPERPDAGTM